MPAHANWAWVVAVLLFVMPPPARASGLLPFDAIYTLTSGSTTLGEMHLTLEIRGNHEYRYMSHSRATGLIGRLIGGQITESSEGSVAADRVRPERYAYQREGRKAREVVLRFDWDKGQVVNIVNDDPWVMGIPPGTVDKLAVQLALMLDLVRGRQNLQYPIADGGTLKEYHFEVAGRETLETPLGAIATVRIKRDRGHAERYTELWCAPQWGYAPVQVIQYRKNVEKARLTLRSITAKTTDTH